MKVDVKVDLSLLDHLIVEEIRRIVAEAIMDGGMLSASEAAAQIVRAYNGSRLNQAEIENRVMMAAASAGVAVEFGSQEELRKSG